MREVPLSGDRAVVIDCGERLQHVLAFFRKHVGHIHELSPTVGQAVGHDRLQLARQIAGKSVESGNGTPKFPCSVSSRWKGIP
jgi:hypothetical protein